MLGHHNVVKILINNGADVNARDYYQCTALHHASENGHHDMVQVLIENQADVNARDKDQETPLHKASWCEHKRVVEQLVQNGADTNAKDKYGETAQDKEKISQSLKSASLQPSKIKESEVQILITQPLV